MGKTLARHAVAVLLGTLAGMVLMTVLHQASALAYPVPKDLDPMSSDPAKREAARAFFASLPAGAFLLAWLAHGLGCLSGAAVGMLLSGRASLIPAGIIGAIFTAAGVVNLMLIPHPTWFALVDVPTYLAVAFAAGRLLVRRAAAPAPGPGG